MKSTIPAIAIILCLPSLFSCSLNRTVVNVAHHRLDPSESRTIYTVPADKKLVLKDLSIATRFTGVPYEPLLNFSVCVKGGVTSPDSECTMRFSFYGHNNIERAYSAGYVFPPRASVRVSNSSNSKDSVFVGFAGYLQEP